VYEQGTLNPAEVILRKRVGKRENNGGGKPNWDTLYVFMEMTQLILLYN
jgi:hypothetical protein